MPQLVKGGKYIYGISEVNPRGSIVIPPDAFKEYGFQDGNRAILFNGSQTSGGFGLTRLDIFEKSAMAALVKAVPELFEYRIPESEVITFKGRKFCWTVIRSGGRIELPPDTLSQYDIAIWDLLAVGRGSRFSIAFISRGPIMEECRKHPELEVFTSSV